MKATSPTSQSSIRTAAIQRLNPSTEGNASPPPNEFSPNRRRHRKISVLFAAFVLLLLAASGLRAQQCVSIQCPTNQTYYVCNTNGLWVYYAPIASNSCDPTNLTVVCSPSSGSWFTLGDKTVDCTVYGSGFSNHCSFTVTVLQDPKCQPPTNCLSIQIPPNIIANTCGSNCLPVSFNVRGINSCNPQDFSVATDLPSGYCFPLGTTWVHATASGSGQTAQASFSVTVLSQNCEASGCPGNLIVNGSFEMPDVPNTPGHFSPAVGAWLTVPPGGSGIPGWEVIDAPVSITTFPYNEGYETLFAADGLQAADLTAEPFNGQGGLQQTVATMPGYPYVLKFQLGLHAGSSVYHGPVRVRVTAGSTSQVFVNDPPGTSLAWTSFEMPFTSDPGSSSTTIKFENLDAQYWSGLDNVCLTPGPTNCIDIHCPTNVTAYACESNCVSVPFNVWATDRCSSNQVSVVTDLPSGYCFPLGTIWVNATATGSGQTAQCSFPVTVLPNPDCGTPTNCIDIHCPTNVTAYVCGSNCVSVPFNVWATDRCSSNQVSVVTDLPSGYCFPLGTIWVNATASGSGQTAQCSFPVTVLPNPNCGNGCSSNLLVNGSFEAPSLPDGYAALPGSSTTIGGWVTLLNGLEYYNPRLPRYSSTPALPPTVSIWWTWRLPTRWVAASSKPLRLFRASRTASALPWAPRRNAAATALLH